MSWCGLSIIVEAGPRCEQLQTCPALTAVAFSIFVLGVFFPRGGGFNTASQAVRGRLEVQPTASNAGVDAHAEEAHVPLSARNAGPGQTLLDGESEIRSATL